MASLTVYDEAGGEVGKYEIDTEQIASRISKQLLHDAVVMYQANLRQGSHNTRTRGQVAGTTKKLYRQKGTGNARAGSKRTNVRRGGGVARTIKPRDYSYRLNRKAVQLATRMAIRSKIDDGEVVVVDKLSFDAPKTQRMASALKALGLSDTTTLIATASPVLTSIPLNTLPYAPPPSSAPNSGSLVVPEPERFMSSSWPAGSGLQ